MEKNKHNTPSVIYIIGDNRSGSTLLDYLLSWHPDAKSVGELHNLRNYYFRSSKSSNMALHKRLCGCGQPLYKCQYWATILKKVNFSKNFRTHINFPTFGTGRSLIMDKLQERIIDNLLSNPENLHKGKEVASNCWQLYKTIAQKTGKHILIDSSKSAIQAYFLNKYSEGKIRFLFLERKIGAVAYSKLNHLKAHSLKTQSEPPSIYTIIIKTYRKLYGNLYVSKKINEEAPEDDKKILHCKYINLAKNPKRTIKNITSSLEIKPYNPPAYTNRIKENGRHTIGGSPSRYKSRKIQPDLRYLNFYKRHKLAKTLKYITEKKLHIFDNYKAIVSHYHTLEATSS